MALGIAFDIGAYECKLAILRDEKLEPAGLLTGERVMSVAYVEEDGTITVRGADLKAARNPSRGVWNVKRSIILGNQSLPGLPGVSPVEVYKAFVKELLRSANEQLLKNGDKPIDSIVLTVPAILEDKPDIAAQLKSAAESIELGNGKRLKAELLIEPAGVGEFNLNALDKSGERKKSSTVIVFDLGHSTLDVALITSYADRTTPYKLHDFRSDAEIYAQYFDSRIEEEIISTLLNGREPTKKEGFRIREAAREIKHGLSDNASYTAELELGDDYVEFTMTRERFNALASAKIEEGANYVREALEIARENNLKVSSIILSGGGCYMPIVSERIKQVAGEIPVQRSLKPIDAVSFGASRYALLHDMIQQSKYGYGIKLPAQEGEKSLDYQVRVMIPSGTRLPAVSEHFKIPEFVCDKSGIYKTILYSASTGKEETVSADACNQIRHMAFDIPADSNFDFTMEINEDHCVKLVCHANGNRYVMTSHDGASARSRKE